MNFVLTIESVPIEKNNSCRIETRIGIHAPHNPSIGENNLELTDRRGAAATIERQTKRIQCGLLWHYKRCAKSGSVLHNVLPYIQ